MVVCSVDTPRREFPSSCHALCLAPGVVVRLGGCPTTSSTTTIPTTSTSTHNTECNCSRWDPACVFDNTTGTFQLCGTNCTCGSDCIVNHCCISVFASCRPETTTAPDNRGSSEDDGGDRDDLLPLWIVLGVLGVCLVAVLIALIYKVKLEASNGSVAPSPPIGGPGRACTNELYAKTPPYGSSRTHHNPVYTGQNGHVASPVHYETMSDSDDDV